MNHWSCRILAVCIFLYVPAVSLANETHVINGRPVLLYKIINWWYYALPEEAETLCGQRFTSTARNAVQMGYDPERQRLTLTVDGDIEPMVSLGLGDGHDVTKRRLVCIRQEAEVVNRRPTARIGADPDTIVIIFDGISMKTARDVHQPLVLDIEGTIGGLMNGRIALHTDGRLLQHCPATTGENPVTMTIRLAASRKPLARFEIRKD